MEHRKDIGKITVGSELWGDKLYQVRARDALPLLVRQSKAEQAIFYSELAAELRMPNPRNLNYPLGTIGNTLVELSQQWKTKIPPIQCLVINKSTGLPGEGFAWFVQDKDAFRRSSNRQKRQIIARMLDDVFTFDRWDEVLAELRLKPAPYAIPAAFFPRSITRGGGESPAHKSLKIHVSRNPQIIGLPVSAGTGETEFIFPSADVLDVLFKYRDEWVGVEVKSAHSDTEDITRGIFQCVKYLALMEALQKAKQLKPQSRVILLLEDKFPDELMALKNSLGINIIDNVSP